MRNVADSKAACPSKREIIVGDGEKSKNEHPVKKSVKRDAQPTPSREVTELQQKIRKLKDKYEYACRAASDAEKRVEFLENLIDSKRELSGDETKSVLELEKNELARENESLKKGMAQMRKEHNEKMTNLINRVSDVQAKDRAIIDELTAKLAQTSDDQTRDGARIADLTKKLTQFEEEKKLLQQQLDDLEEQQQSVAPAAVHVPPPKKVAELPKICHSKRELKDDETKSVLELENKLAEISSQLDEARREAEIATILKIELARENESLKKGMAQMRKDHNEKLTNQLEGAARREAQSLYNNRDLAREMEILKSEMAKMSKEHNDSLSINKGMANLINRANDNQAQDRSIIDELTHRLAQYEGGLQRQPMHQLHQSSHPRLQPAGHPMAPPPWPLLQHPQQSEFQGAFQGAGSVYFRDGSR